MSTTIERIPDHLDAAQRERRPIDALPDTLTLDDAYWIQHGVLGRRTSRGERPVGIKLGFTSRAKMAQMGVSEIVVGQLTDAMRIPDGGAVALSGFIHPRIEPEIAFRLAWDIDVADPHADIEGAVDAVAPALEIIDSRYRDFRFTLPSVIADNTSAAGFVLGPWRPPGIDLANRAVRLEVNGAAVAHGTTAAILGHPMRALHALVPVARARGFRLHAGQIVLAGAASAAVAFQPGRVSAIVAGVGRVDLRGVDG
ncbi:fumarylacetoacetate hydrolase family protein [Dactylosporangium sp. NPDC000555]|uniref:2-keto-4-pentenoate hydratase n=1 Tax=Dactylosporangium sp. NPDC000555 TaxID=3154260 RepID=UPI0033330ED7